MKLPERRTRLVAAREIEVRGQRLLPSVLVETVAYRAPGYGVYHQMRARPASIVVEGPESAQWLEIPDETTAILSQMAAVAAGIALISTLIIGIVHYLRRK